MLKNVFFPQYAKAGSVDILTKYSIGNKSYNVYLITIDDKIKFVHDKREKGRLEFVTIENAIKSVESIDNQIRELNNRINKLKKIKEQNQYIISVLQNNASDGEIKFSKQPNIQNKKVNNGEQPRKKFIINTPLGYVADVDGFVVAFTEDKHEAQAFDNQEKAIKLGKNIFQNQLPFRVETLNSFKKEYNNHKCHCSNEGDFIFVLLHQMFPNANIKGFVIDEKGNIQEL